MHPLVLSRFQFSFSLETPQVAREIFSGLNSQALKHHIKPSTQQQTQTSAAAHKLYSPFFWEVISIPRQGRTSKSPRQGSASAPGRSLQQVGAPGSSGAIATVTSAPRGASDGHHSREEGKEPSPLTALLFSPSLNEGQDGQGRQPWWETPELPHGWEALNPP